MKRERKDNLTTETLRLRGKRRLSGSIEERTTKIAAEMMEIDACRQLGGLNHPSANGHLWIDETGEVHEGEFR